MAADLFVSNARHTLAHTAVRVYLLAAPFPHHCPPAAGLIGCSGVRLPLVGLAPESDAKLTAALKAAGLL